MVRWRKFWECFKLFESCLYEKSWSQKFGWITMMFPDNFAYAERLFSNNIKLSKRYPIWEISVTKLWMNNNNVSHVYIQCKITLSLENTIKSSYVLIVLSQGVPLLKRGTPTCQKWLIICQKSNWNVMDEKNVSKM